MTCPACGSEVPESSRFCLTCGVELGATRTIPRHKTAVPISTPSSGTSDGARFIPGTTFVGRYRIVSLLGKGGMGEVYRADDLKLSQMVALKFLPEALAHDGTALARFHREVRTARQVSHPNVCRVFDIGDAEGVPFFTMEYVDGEDLASLIRRIGRLPPDKALEVARQLCAGLAAAHDYGVVHRDFKPANVMIDARGKARITDFGLAGMAADPREREPGAGTPAYMAPEQLQGKEGTVRSDLYSLGLVLYEVFTGRRAFEPELLRVRQQTLVTPPSQLVKDLDPLVERVILRCLEDDPARRPASASQVAKALPGGDPLAEALAAGETPSPEMVAASGSKDGLRPSAAWACLGTVLAGFLVVAVLNGTTQLWNLVPLEKPPEVLAEKAREVLESAGYAQPFADNGSSFDQDLDYLRYVTRTNKTPARLNHLSSRAIVFWYRQSPQPLVSLRFPGGGISANDPPLDTPEMALVRMDAGGRLLLLKAVPPQLTESLSPVSAPDWRRLFAEAGLDPASFSSTEPKWTPPVYGDVRAAWTGTIGGEPAIPVRVEAASYRGKPVYFELIHPWTQTPGAAPTHRTPRRNAAVAIEVTLFFALVLGGAALAWRNLRAGRGDRQGAFRLAAIVFGLAAAGWVLGIHHVGTLYEVGLFVTGVAACLFAAALLWTLYVALEPYVRRNWPRILVTWSRLLSGETRDPLVGRDILFGCVAGVAWRILEQVSDVAPSWLGLPQGIPLFHPGLAGLLAGGRSLIATLPLFAVINAAFAMSFVFLLFLLRLALRNSLAASVAFVGVLTTMYALAAELPWATAPFLVLMFATCTFVMVRFGLVALMAACLFEDCLIAFPLTLRFSTWYVGIGLAGAAMLAGIALFGFYNSMGARAKRRMEPAAA